MNGNGSEATMSPTVVEIAAGLALNCAELQLDRIVLYGLVTGLQFARFHPEYAMALLEEMHGIAPGVEEAGCQFADYIVRLLPIAVEREAR